MKVCEHEDCVVVYNSVAPTPDWGIDCPLCTEVARTDVLRKEIQDLLTEIYQQIPVEEE
jgi:hypothetical protein